MRLLGKETNQMSSSQSVVFDPQERRILTLASASHFLTHFFMLVFPALVIPISTDLGIPIASALTLSFWMYLLYGLLALGWGFISDHWGHRWAMSSGLVVGGIGLALAGLAHSFLLLSAAFALVGIGSSAYHPSGTALVSQGVRQRGRALGINGIWGNAGIASAPLVVGILGFAIGWRIALEILGGIGVLIGLAAMATPFSVERGTDRAAVNRLEQRAGLRLFAVFCIGLIFGGFMYRSFTLILPTFLETRLQGLISGVQGALANLLPGRSSVSVDTLTANVIASIVYIVGIVGQTLGGRAADRFSLKWIYLIFFSASLPFIVLAQLSQSVLMIPMAGLYVFFALGMQPIENSLIAALTPARWRSVSYGVKFTLNFGAGSFAVMLMSAVSSRFGVGNSLWVVACFVVLVVLNTTLFLFLSRGQEIRQ